MRERQFNHRGTLASSLPARSSFRHLGTRSTAIMVLVCSALFASTVSAGKKFDESKLEFVDNGTIKLGSASSYKRALSYLMFKPVLDPEKGGWAKIKRIHLGR